MRQVLCAERAGPDLGEVEHPDAFQRPSARRDARRCRGRGRSFPRDAGDLGGVLSDGRRRPSQRPHGRAVLRGGAGQPEVPHARLVEVDEEPAGPQMLVVVHLAHAVDRCERDPVGLCLAVEVVHFPRTEPVLHEELEGVQVLAADQPVGEDLLVGPIRVAHELDKPLPLLLFDRQRKDLAIDGVGDEPRPQGPGTKAGCLAPGVGPVHEVHLEHGGDGLLLGHVDGLSDPGDQPVPVRRQRRECRVASGVEVALGAEGLERRQFGRRRRARAQERPSARVRRGQLVAAPMGAGPVVAEHRDRRHDELRELAAQLAAVQSRRRPIGGRDVVDEDVGIGEERGEVFLTARSREIGDGGPLVRVEVDEQPALVPVGSIARERPPVAGPVAVWRLDFDHVGTDIGQQLRGVGGRHARPALHHPGLRTTVPARR